MNDSVTETSPLLVNPGSQAACTSREDGSKVTNNQSGAFGKNDSSSTVKNERMSGDYADKGGVKFEQELPKDYGLSEISDVSSDSLSTFASVRRLAGHKTAFEEWELLRERKDIWATYSELTRSLRKSTFPEGGVGLASFYLRDALLGTNSTGRKTYNPYWGGFNHRRSMFSLLSRKIVLTKSFVALVKIASFCLVLLSFVEPPSWCVGLSETSCKDLLDMRGPPAFGDDTEIEVEYYPTFHMMYLTKVESFRTEIALTFVLFLHSFFSIGVDGMSLKRYFDPSTGERWVRLTRLISVIGLTMGLVYQGISGTQRPFALFWRIAVFITLSKGVLRELEFVVKLIPDFLRIFAIFLIVHIFYAWIGVILFFQTKEGLQHFPNLSEAMWTLWIMATTANYPDVMMPAYNEKRLVFLYFVSYMVAVFFGLMNLILAAVVNSYTNELERYADETVRKRREKLKQAFQCLDRNRRGYIDRETLMAVFLLLNEDCPDIRYISQECGELFFAFLDKDGSEKITEDEFQDLGKVMQLEFERADAYKTLFEISFPKAFRSRWFQNLCRVVKSDQFELFIDVLLILNAVVVAIQSYPELTGQDPKDNPKVADGEIDTAWEIVETVFTVIYCIEMMLKILVLGGRQYFESHRNTFDAIITILTLASTCYVYYPNDFSDSRLIRYIVMARVLRLVRVFVAIQQFQVVGKTLVDILPAAGRIFLLLLDLLFVYAAIGMRWFGGKINRDPLNVFSEKLNGTEFADNDYWANNFNDMMSGMNSLFNLLVVNNWPESASGLEAIAGKWSRFFFLTFHLFGVIMINNIVIAFIIDSFTKEWDTSNALRMKGEADGFSIDERAHAIFDASEITGTKTTLSGDYIVKIRARSQTHAMKRLKIRKMFTKSNSDAESGCSTRNGSTENEPMNVELNREAAPVIKRGT